MSKKKKYKLMGGSSIGAALGGGAVLNTAIVPAALADTFGGKHTPTSGMSGIKGRILKNNMPVKETSFGMPGVTGKYRFGKIRGGTLYGANKLNPGVYGHEMGHLRLRQNLGHAGQALDYARILAPLAGVGTAATLTHKVDPESRKAKVAPYIAAGGYLPMLADEGIASYYSIKATGGKDLKSLALGFGTYAGLAAGTGIGMELYRRHKVKQKKKLLDKKRT